MRLYYDEIPNAVEIILKKHGISVFAHDREYNCNNCFMFL